MVHVVLKAPTNKMLLGLLGHQSPESGIPDLRQLPEDALQAPPLGSSAGELGVLVWGHFFLCSLLERGRRQGNPYNVVGI